jgi:hypothetical protein
VGSTAGHGKPPSPPSEVLGHEIWGHEIWGQMKKQHFPRADRQGAVGARQAKGIGTLNL